MKNFIRFLSWVFTILTISAGVAVLIKLFPNDNLGIFTVIYPFIAWVLYTFLEKPFFDKLFKD